MNINPIKIGKNQVVKFKQILAENDAIREMPAITQEQIMAKHKATIAARSRRTGEKQPARIEMGEQMGMININDGSTVQLPLTDETALLVIPKIGGHGLYVIYRESGMPINKAVFCVMCLMTGKIEQARAIKSEYGL